MYSFLRSGLEFKQKVVGCSHYLLASITSLGSFDWLVDNCSTHGPLSNSSDNNSPWYTPKILALWKLCSMKEASIPVSSLSVCVLLSKNMYLSNGVLPSSSGGQAAAMANAYIV